MTQFIRAMRPVFCSFLFISVAYGLFAVFGSGLKAYQPQTADSDNLHEVLKKARSATEGIKSFRIRIETPGVKEGCAGSCTGIWEYASPDRARVASRIAEMIWVGKSIYQKKADGSWEKFEKEKSEKESSEPKPDFPARVLKQYIEAVEKADEVKFIGREDVNGIPALAYQHTRYYGSDKKESHTEKTWFREADGSLLRNQIYCIVIGSTPSPVNYTFYDYNADIKIEPPTEYVSVAAPREGIIGRPKALAESYPRKADEINPDGGYGTGKGGGIGSGDGTGLGPGRGFNTGGGDPRIRSNASATSVDEKPVPLNAPRPNYTEAARNNKIQGVVRVKVLVGADGEVKQVRVTSGLPDGLNDQAIHCAYQFRFKPAMKNGQPVSYWVGVDIEFNLR